MVSRMSGIDEINDRLTSICTGLVASVCAVMDEKMSENVDNEKNYEVLNFLFFSFTPKRTISSSEDNSLRLYFRARSLRNTMAHIVKGMVPYINTKRKPNGRESTSGWMNWMDRTNACASYVNPRRVGQQRMRR